MPHRFRAYSSRLDYLLLFLVTSLTFFGGITILSTEINTRYNNWLQHITFGALGVGICLIIARWNYRRLLEFHWVIYALTNLILVTVKIIGSSANGAQSWVSIAGIKVEPSEFAKIGIIITLCALLHRKPINNPFDLIKVLGITALPWLLVFFQPDLGTSLVFGAITLGILYWSNINRGWLLLLVSPIVSMIIFNVYFVGWIVWAILLAVVAWLSLPWKRIGTLGVLLATFLTGWLSKVLWSVLKNYQKERILVFLDPDKDIMGSGYQLTQSRIAIGSGGLWGKGLFHGPQTQLNFVPEQHTDFIFSAVAEEWGFVGAVAVVLVFWLICLRLLLIANSARDNFGSLLVIGVFSMILFQAIVNIGMTIGLAPITGIPLPWLTYGRSSLMTNFIAIGLAESVANFRPNPKDY
jgi:rod shape determining protein RodA